MNGGDIGVGDVAVASNSVLPHEKKDVMNDQAGKLLVVESDDFGGANFAIPVRFGESILKP